MKPLILLLCVLCALCGLRVELFAADRLIQSGGWPVASTGEAFLPRFKETPEAIYIRACQQPFRSIAGGRFENLNPLFHWLTNTSGRHASAPRPLTNWAVIHGKVTDISPRGIIVELSDYLATPGYGHTAHLVNHPDQATLTDGKYIFVLAKHTGRIQYKNVRGETVTVPSFDHGRAPTPDELAGVRGTRQKMSSQNLSNSPTRPTSPTPRPPP